jgi:2'-5' RNA ligase
MLAGRNAASRSFVPLFLDLEEGFGYGTEQMSIRVFVGIQLSVSATRQLSEAAEAPRKAVDAAAKVSWVPAKNLHVTLKFIGDIADELLEGVVVATRKAAGNVAPVRVGIKGFGAFPSEAGAQPHILWASVGEMLAPLHAEIEKQLEAVGFAREARPYHAHVTLGRVRECADQASDAVKRAWQKADVALMESIVDSVVVFESRMMPTGIAYIERARLPLKQVLRAREESSSRANQ